MPRPVTPLSQASVPLSVALRAHFSKPLAKLPKALRDLVHAEFFSPWDELSPSRRKEIAEFLDQLCDANTKRDAASLQRVFDQREALQNELRDLHGLATSTESEQTNQIVRKGTLEQELAHLDAYIQQSRGDYPPRSIDDERTRSSFTYISHPQAARRLTERYQARPCEMAAWVFLGSAAGGFTAYVPSNEGLEPAWFRFGYEMADDYISPLFGCVFDGEEIDRFQPTDRYITGADLLAAMDLSSQRGRRTIHSGHGDPVAADRSSPHMATHSVRTPRKPWLPTTNDRSVFDHSNRTNRDRRVPSACRSHKKSWPSRGR